MKIAVAGTGYVGLSMATLLAQNHSVVAVDIVPEKVEKINRRVSPIQDEYIEKYYYTVKVIDPTVTTLDVLIYGEPEADDNSDDYVYTKYTNDDGNIVAVTYGGKNGNDNEAKVTFILNYNFFDVTVEYAGKEYTLEGFGYIKIDH